VEISAEFPSGAQDSVKRAVLLVAFVSNFAIAQAGVENAWRWMLGVAARARLGLPVFLRHDGAPTRLV
jgi:hypothetical protein